MKNKLIIALFIVFSFKGFAQSYNLTTFSAPYVNLASPVSLNNGLPWDDDVYTIALPFDLNFYDRTITVLQVSGNGIVYDETFDTLWLMSTYSADLVDRSTGATSSSPLSYEISGSVGSQLLKVEWNNAGFFDGLSTSFMNCQFWYYEADHSIEFRMGPNNVTDPMDCFFGDPGPQCGLMILDYNSGSLPKCDWLAGPSASPSLVTAGIDTAPPLDDVPVDSMAYRFTPIVTGVNSNLSEMNYSIQPNPSTGFITVAGLKSDAVMETYNDAGILVKSEKLSAGIYKTDLRSLQKGIYMLRIIDHNNAAIKRLVLQ